MRLLAVALAALAVSCACSEKPPNPPTSDAGCLGCLNALGLCESGMTHAACGSRAKACVACADGSKCLNGICAFPWDGGEVFCGGVSCGTGGDLCLDGVCSCDGVPPCAGGSTCREGRCVCGPCDGGCCSNGFCLTATRSQAACGKNGALCLPCSPGDNLCSAQGDCMCGLHPTCDAGVACNNGECDLGNPCPDGCSQGNTCIPFAQQTVAACGAAGGLCGLCDFARADHCLDGVCHCGSGGSCPGGQLCQGGACVCNAAACPTGCCLNNVCVERSVQSSSQCGPPGGECIACPPGALCLTSGCDCRGRLSCGATAVSAGADLTCATTVSGALRCWGTNLDGGADVSAPVDVLPGVPVNGVASGTQLACASTGQGVWCLGALSMSANLPSPTSLTAGARHACALSQGRAWCWGANEHGQLGIAGADGGFVATPTPVDGLDGGITQIAAGATHTCALSGGLVWCWGRFDASMSSPNDSPVPRVVTMPSTNGARLLASGDGVSCAALPGQVVCWGNASMQFFASAVSLAVGSGFGCLASNDGGVQCWGSNAHGQLGAPDAGASSLFPVSVPGLHGARAVSCGRAHACAIADSLQVWCWGEGAHGKLGNGSTMDALQPTPVGD